MARWERHRHLFLWKYIKKGQNSPFVCFYGHIMVCGQHYKSRKWFLCTAHDLKHAIKYQTAIKWADDRATGTYFCENIQKMFKMSSRELFYGLFMVFGQHYKSSIWFLCTTYGLKHVIEYHKGDKMTIWAVYKPIRAKIHHFLWFREDCVIGGLVFGYNSKSKGFKALKLCCVWHN